MATPRDLSLYSPDRPQIAKVRYTHDALIELTITNPEWSQAQLAEAMGYTEAWISTIMASDAFEARRAERRSQIVDPVLSEMAEHNFKALVLNSQRILAEKLEATQSADLALNVLSVSSKALGYGARAAGPAVQVNQQFLVSAPLKAASSEEWEANALKIVEAA